MLSGRSVNVIGKLRQQLRFDKTTIFTAVYKILHCGLVNVKSSGTCHLIQRVNQAAH